MTILEMIQRNRIPDKNPNQYDPELMFRFCKKPMINPKDYPG
jgi:hypothetical protein